MITIHKNKYIYYVATAFCINKDEGLFCCCFHNISDAENIRIGKDWNNASLCVLIRSDREHNLAIIQMKDVQMRQNFEQVTFNFNIDTGEEIFTISYLCGEGNCRISKGRILLSGIIEPDYENLIWHSSSLSSGCGGSPLFNSLEQVIGINCAYDPYKLDVSYAIHAKYLAALMN